MISLVILSCKILPARLYCACFYAKSVGYQKHPKAN